MKKLLETYQDMLDLKGGEVESWVVSHLQTQCLRIPQELLLKIFLLTKKMKNSKGGGKKRKNSILNFTNSSLSF